MYSCTSAKLPKPFMKLGIPLAADSQMSRTNGKNGEITLIEDATINDLIVLQEPALASNFLSEDATSKELIVLQEPALASNFLTKTQQKDFEWNDSNIPSVLQTSKDAAKSQQQNHTNISVFSNRSQTDCDSISEFGKPDKLSGVEITATIIKTNISLLLGESTRISERLRELQEDKNTTAHFLASSNRDDYEDFFFEPASNKLERSQLGELIQSTSMNNARIIAYLAKINIIVYDRVELTFDAADEFSSENSLSTKKCCMDLLSDLRLLFKNIELFANGELLAIYKKDDVVEELTFLDENVYDEQDEEGYEQVIFTDMSSDELWESQSDMQDFEFDLDLGDFDVFKAVSSSAVAETRLEQAHEQDISDFGVVTALPRADVDIETHQQRLSDLDSSMAKQSSFLEAKKNFTDGFTT